MVWRPANYLHNILKGKNITFRTITPSPYCYKRNGYLAFKFTRTRRKYMQNVYIKKKRFTISEHTLNTSSTSALQNCCIAKYKKRTHDGKQIRIFPCEREGHRLGRLDPDWLFLVVSPFCLGLLGVRPHVPRLTGEGLFEPRRCLAGQWQHCRITNDTRWH